MILILVTYFYQTMMLEFYANKNGDHTPTSEHNRDSKISPIVASRFARPRYSDLDSICDDEDLLSTA